MKTFKQYSNLTIISMLFMLTIFAAGCSDSSSSSAATEEKVSAIPVVASTVPDINGTAVAPNRSIVAFFNKALDPSTVNTTTFTLIDNNTSLSVDGNVSYANNAMLFNPTADLNASTEYNATITTGVKNLAGEAMAAEYVWNFTTGTTADSTAPDVNSTGPDDNATDVPYNRSPSAVFSETLDPTTVSTATFTLVATVGSIPVAGAVSYESKTMIFNPTADLDLNKKYTATITTGVTDLAGNPLGANKVWSFTTGTTAVSSLSPVDLGTAGSFVILSKTAISTTGTAITGDIGVSPIALTAITGFTPMPLSADGTYATSAQVTGKIYASNLAVPTPAKMTAAISDMQTAYTAAAGRTLPDYTELGAGDVSAMTLAPGLYKWSSDLLIDNRGVTLSGGATDVWIFQIAQKLTLNTNSIVTLTGGALAKNIFWQVKGDVTLNSGANFKGIVLTEKAINVGTTVVVKGRLLAQTAVAANGTSVTKP